MIAFPDGQLMTPLALPVQILALALSPLVPTVVAWNLSVLALVALQGLAFVALGAAWGWTPWQRLATVVAAQTCPLLLSCLCNGQVEQIGLATLALIAWALWRFGWARLVAAGLGLALALAFSPYQAIIAGPLLLLLALGHGWRRLLAAAGVVLVCSLITQVIFHAEGSRLHPATALPGGEMGTMPVGESEDPPSARIAEAMGSVARARVANTAAILDLVVPRVDGVLGHKTGDYVRPAERLRAVLRPVRAASLPETSPTELPVAPTYLGALTLLAGGLGLWRARGCRKHRLLALWAAICFLLALGPHLSVLAGRPTGFPLPWAVVANLPAIALAGATVRFLGALAFACVLGIAWLVRAWRPWQANVFVVLLAATNLLFTPAQWPRTSVGLEVGDLTALLPPGPVAVWPGVGAVPAEENLLLAIALDRPVAVFNPTGLEVEDQERAAAAWLANAQGAGVQVLLERSGGAWRQVTPIRYPPPLPPEARIHGEAQGYRVWLLGDLTN
jgi:hypothetical protein